MGPHLAAFAGEVEKQARSQAARAAAMAEAMEQLARDLHAAVAELRTSSEQMERALETVGQIADHTRILSINASIEAARAGEQGRAFAVIVDEVKQLADRTGRTTLAIGERMGEFAASLGRMDAVVTQAKARRMADGARSTPTVGDVKVQVRGIAESAGFQLTNAESVHAMGDQVKALTESLLLAVGKFRFAAHDRAREAVAELVPALTAALGDRPRLEALLEEWLRARPHFELAYLTDAQRAAGRSTYPRCSGRAGRLRPIRSGFLAATGRRARGTGRRWPRPGPARPTSTARAPPGTSASRSPPRCGIPTGPCWGSSARGCEFPAAGQRLTRRGSRPHAKLARRAGRRADSAGDGRALEDLAWRGRRGGHGRTGPAARPGQQR